MELLYELESLADNASDDIGANTSPTTTDIARWKDLFDLSSLAAQENIVQYRADRLRPRLLDELWEDIKEQKVSEGYDREAYEYHVFCHNKNPRPSSTTEAVTGVDTHSCAVLLGGPLDSAKRIREIARLSQLPRVATVEAESNTDATEICYVDSTAKTRILEWLAREGSDFKPVFITFSMARKQLCCHSAYPTLGIDSTLPPNRKDGQSTRPTQDQYPVWYFFYGTLADPELLMRFLPLDEAPRLENACVTGGTLRTWGNRYRALVDGSDTVAGHSFLVQNRTQEEALRVYEGSMYEVVRCTIQTAASGAISGLTFRFIDDTQLDWIGALACRQAGTRGNREPNQTFSAKRSRSHNHARLDCGMPKRSGCACGIAIT